MSFLIPSLRLPCTLQHLKGYLTSFLSVISTYRLFLMFFSYIHTLFKVYFIKYKQIQNLNSDTHGKGHFIKNKDPHA